MKTNRLKNKLAQVVRTLLMLLGFVAISLQMGAVSSAQQPGAGIRLLIPSSAYSDAFTSSLVVMNLQIGSNTFTISAYDTSGNPLGTPLTTSLLYGQQFRSSNILKELGAPFGSFGPIKVQSLSSRLLWAASEVRSNQGFAGFFPGVNVEAAWREGFILDVIDDGPRGAPATYRTNLGLNALMPGTTSVTVTLFNDSGQGVGTISRTLAGNGLTQLDGIVQQLRSSNAVTRGYLRITSSQPIIAWASKIDNGTDDPSFQIGVGWFFPITSLSWMTSRLNAEVAQDFLQCVSHWDWKGGENAMRRAIELDPNNVDAHYNFAVLLMALAR
ncbi:MAG: hypothetical protein L0312_01650, partial [Acidobacteria bacterium]|nr:hypothetical protein [Acidobacteriota bacterium]